MACEVRPAGGKGRGLFALQDFAEGWVVSRAHVALMPFLEDNGQPPEHPVEAFLFEWDEKHSALALGPMSFVNHSDKPNCDIDYDYAGMIIRLRANRLIPAGEELTIDYSCKLWFEDAK